MHGRPAPSSAGRYLLTGSAEYQYFFKSAVWRAPQSFTMPAMPPTRLSELKLKSGVRRGRALAQPGRPDQYRCGLRRRRQKSPPALLSWFYILMTPHDPTPDRPRQLIRQHVQRRWPRRARHRRVAVTGALLGGAYWYGWAANRRLQHDRPARRQRPAAAAMVAQRRDAAPCTAPCTWTKSVYKQSRTADQRPKPSRSTGRRWQYLSPRHRDQQACTWPA